MKNKGFTLVELLAVIIVLGIIAIIIMPIVQTSLDNSRRGAAEDSAYGYRSAYDKFYAKMLQQNHNFNLNGQYRVAELKEMGLEFQGKAPLDAMSLT